MKYLKILTLASSMALVTASSGLYAGNMDGDAPAISYHWKNTTLKLSSCMKQAKNAMDLTGFDYTARKTLVVGTNNDEYKGTVVCLTAKKMVLFVVSGEEFSMARKLTAKLKKNFSARSKCNYNIVVSRCRIIILIS